MSKIVQLCRGDVVQIAIKMNVMHKTLIRMTD